MGQSVGPIPFARFHYGLKFAGCNMPLLNSWLANYCTSKYMALPLCTKSLVAILKTGMDHNRIKALERLE